MKLDLANLQKYTFLYRIPVYFNIYIIYVIYRPNNGWIFTVETCSRPDEKRTTLIKFESAEIIYFATFPSLYQTFPVNCWVQVIVWIMTPCSVVSEHQNLILTPFSGCTEAITIIAEWNEGRKREIQRNKRSNGEKYWELRRTANNVYKAKKREMMRNKMREIDELSKQQETRKLYTAMKQINRSYQPKAIGCQSKNGEMISDKQRIHGRLREYF